MDAAQSVTQRLIAAKSWGGHTRPHALAWVLSLLLPLLPLDVRARAAFVCRAWRAAASAPALWAELSFEQCAASVSDAALAALCARAGEALRELRLDSVACSRVTCAGMLTALRGGGCSGVRRLWLPPWNRGIAQHWPDDLWLTAEMVQQLAAACPVLEHAACGVRCHLSDTTAVLTALPGPLTLKCASNCGVDVTQLAGCLRVNTTLTSLVLCNRVGDAGAMQLAECLRVNATLMSLNLWNNVIGDAGATMLAECLRVNATLTKLNLTFNKIGDAGATQLAECLRVNAALTSLVLNCNGIGPAGASELLECLRVNTTLTSLSLRQNHVGDAGAVHVAEHLRGNTTLTSLNLQYNLIGYAGLRALHAACPPRCELLL